MDTYQPEIVNSLRRAGFYTRSAPTIPPERWKQYKVSRPKKSEADLFVIRKTWGALIEIKTANGETLSYANKLQEGQWEWAEQAENKEFSVWYAIMFNNLDLPKGHPHRTIARELLLVPFHLLKMHRTRTANLGAPDIVRYNNRSGVPRLIQDHKLAAMDMFPGYFCTWNKGYWTFPAGPFAN